MDTQTYNADVTVRQLILVILIVNRLAYMPHIPTLLKSLDRHYFLGFVLFSNGKLN